MDRVKVSNKYEVLMVKISKTRKYIDSLARIESNMKADVEENIIEQKVVDIVEKCIDDINEIYINSEKLISADLETRLKGIEGHKNAIDEHNKAIERVKNEKDKTLVDSTRYGQNSNEYNNGTPKEELS